MPTPDPTFSLRGLLKAEETLIPLSRPDIGPLEIDRVRQVLLSGRLALGPACRSFESAVAELCGTRFAVSVSSGTAALHLIVKALGLSDGDEVITTPFSFIASANAALFENARPVFVDIDKETLNIDVTLIEQSITRRTRAILAVDIFGLPAKWPDLVELAAKHDLLLIDDACEAIGARIDDRPIGGWANATAFGFYPNKQITTGEGGCITTDDEDLANVCRSMANQGRSEQAVMRHIRLGFNYRMDEMSAALGCAQLERFSELQAKRAAVAAAYDRSLEALRDELRLPARPGGTTRSWFAYVVRLSDEFGYDARDELQQTLRAQGIESSPYFPAIHHQPYYSEQGYRDTDFPVAEQASARALALPFFTQLTEAAVDQVAAAIKRAITSLSRTRRVFAAA